MADYRRQQLADVLPEILGPSRLVTRSTGTPELTGFGNMLVDALLPLFDRVEADAAAEALEGAASDLRAAALIAGYAPGFDRGLSAASDALRARAAAHRTPAPSSEENAR